MSKCAKTASTLAGLSLACGCTIFQSPQVYPDEWRTLDMRPASSSDGVTETPLTPSERAEFARPPADLDESVARTFKLLRHYTVRGNAADAVPQQVGNLLIGLTSFGAYRAITHPSAKTTAGVAALGTAAYAAGSGVKWGDRAAAYNRAVEGLICLLNEADPFIVWPVRRTGDDPVETGYKQLERAIDNVSSSISNLDHTLAMHAGEIAVRQKSAASVTKGTCPEVWGDEVCKPLIAGESNRYQSRCDAIRKRQGKLCASTTIPAVYSTPAVQVEAVFKDARAARDSAENNLRDGSDIQRKSLLAGRKLWHATFDVMNRTNGDVRSTGFDLAELLNKLNAATAPQAKTGTTQGGTWSEVPKNAKSEPRALPSDSSVIADVAMATSRVREAARKLQESNRVNANKPDFNATKFDACISAESKYARVIVEASKPAPAPDSSANKLRTQASAAELNGLDLQPGAIDADIETRLRICQQKVGQPVDGQLTPAMQRILVANECKGLKWE